MGTSSDADCGERYGKTLKEGAGAARALQTYRQLILQMMLCRAVDSFLTYISELLALTYRTKPEMLKSGETVRLDVILQYQAMEDLVSALVERRVSQLSFQGVA